MTTARFAVVWTDVALADVERLAAYLFDEAPVRAEKVLDRIISRAESLSTAPGRGRVPPELRTIGERTWREVIEPPWRILYRVTDDTVEIHAVLDGRRSLEEILLERLLHG